MRLTTSLLLPMVVTLTFAANIARVDSTNYPIPLQAKRQTSYNSTKYAVKEPPLTTPWTYTAGTNPWPEYPRPQLQRSQWLSLNGIWTYQDASSLDALESPPFNQTLAHEVLVPSCLESGLSGESLGMLMVWKFILTIRIGIQGVDTLYSWFSTSFTIPSDWSGQQTLLNFGAIDYEATVFINGKKAGFNRGGYFEFTIDVTDFLSGGHNELYVNLLKPASKYSLTY